MRVLALLLLLLNVGFWFWARYIDVPEAKLLAAAPATSSRAPRLVLSTERDPTELLAAQAANQQAAVELSCVSVGPVADAVLAQTLTQQLQAAGFVVTPRMVSEQVFAGFWVSLPPVAKRAEADQTLKQVQAAGISDAYVLPDGSQFVLSLGLFTDQTHAEQRRAEVAKIGLAPTVQNKTRAQEIPWLDITLQEPGKWPDSSLLQVPGSIVRLENAACGGASSAVTAQG